MSFDDAPAGVDWSTRTIALAGFMGVGKTSIARQLARLIDRPYLDSDSVVVDRLGRSIQAAFAAGEERHFREVERDVVKELARSAPPGVVALGGGALIDDSTLELLLREALLVHIHLPWEAFEALIPKLRRGRPLLVNATVEVRREGVDKSAAVLLEALAPFGIRPGAQVDAPGQLP